jgi:hypothetical protein
LNLTLRNFDFHHSEKKNLNKKEKEKRIKELRYVMTKMEKSIVDAKKKYDLNKKKNEDYIKDNEVLFHNNVAFGSSGKTKSFDNRAD